MSDAVFYFESVCDEYDEADAATPLAHRCDICEAAFISTKTLASHIRAKHKMRSGVSLRVCTSICPCCSIDYRVRARCLDHIGAPSARRCKDFVLTNCAVLPLDVVARADAADNLLRAAARKRGSTRVPADLPALYPDGSVACGRKRRSFRVFDTVA